jgi:hypothetical protein
LLRASSSFTRGGRAPPPATMATLGLSRLLPKPTQNYQVHKDDPSPAALARLEVSIRTCESLRVPGNRGSAALPCVVCESKGQHPPSFSRFLSKHPLVSQTILSLTPNQHNMETQGLHSSPFPFSPNPHQTHTDRRQATRPPLRATQQRLHPPHRGGLR